MRKTVVVTDGKYRASIAAIRVLGRAGYRVIVTQTRADSPLPPPAFASRYAAETYSFPGAVTDPDYPARLRSLLEDYNRPVLLCAGAGTLNAVARERDIFSQYCDFLVPPPDILDALNDKSVVHKRAQELGIPVPREYNLAASHAYERSLIRYPVVIKPRCGEKYGLKAKDRYRIVDNPEEFDDAVKELSVWDAEPVVQEKLTGEGTGASLLLGRNGELLDALCHRRIREYPVSGGPSACCESFYDAKLIQDAYRLLKSFHFQGFAMVEYKAGRVLEVNPRIWGSFPLTEHTGSSMVLRYVRAASGETVEYAPCDYQTGVRMRFLLNDSAAMLDLFRSGQFPRFAAGLPDCVFAQEALSVHDDPAPFRRYLKNTLFPSKRSRKKQNPDH